MRSKAGAGSSRIPSIIRTRASLPTSSSRLTWHVSKAHLSRSLLSVVLSLFSVFWRRLHQHYFGVACCSGFASSTSNATTRFAPLYDHWFAVGAWVPSTIRSVQQTWSAVCEVWLHSVWSVGFVAAAVRRWSPTPVCGLRHGVIRWVVRHRWVVIDPRVSLSSDFSD